MNALIITMHTLKTYIAIPAGLHVRICKYIADLEADLQEVWSVRRNIHHTGKSRTALPSTSVMAGKYSRHGAIPAQQSQAPQSLAQLLTSSKGESNWRGF